MQLIQNIQRESDRLIKIITSLPPTSRTLKVIDGTLCAADLIAYQIGWGKCVIRWYEAGIKGEEPEMPGEGFTKWDYAAIAKHFYKKYRYDASDQQLEVFKQVVNRLIEIASEAHQTGQLDQIGVWTWCTLPSGKEWPLSKWIQVNTAAPYKRAAQLIKNIKECSS